MAGSDARALAATMAADLKTTPGAPLDFGDIDLRPAVEQVYSLKGRARARSSSPT